MSKILGFLKTTAIGGLLALLPLIIIGALVGKAAPIVISVRDVLKGIFQWETPAGAALLLLLAVGIILLLCFAAGLLARRSFGKWMTKHFEKTLMLLFPRYLVIKNQMADTIGGDENQPRMKPVLVRFDDSSQIGFEMERTSEGQVTVYLPGSPDPWAGSVVFFNADQVEALDVEFGKAVATFEKLGRDSSTLLKGKESGPS
jgi:uncharacterized membrane protein